MIVRLTELRWPWLGALLGALLVGLLVWWARRPVSPAAGLHVSHVDRLRSLTRYHRLVHRRRLLVGARALALATAVAGALLLVARPGELTREAPPTSRDVLVCLDVSPSMEPVNAAVVRAVRQVVASLPGDRIGLMVFNEFSVTKVPLTDDRAYVDRALDEAEEAFRDDDPGYSRATEGWRSSQAGDGLHSCVHGFDRLEERRGRVVLLVTDNRPHGPPVHALAGTADQALERGVVVHALAPPWTEEAPRRAAELAAAATTTGGSFARLDDTNAVPDVVDDIDRLERRRIEAPTRETFVDDTRAGALPLVVGVLALVLLGARRRR